jgi:hypothetical protein
MKYINTYRNYIKETILLSDAKEVLSLIKDKISKKYFLKMQNKKQI